jgi:hypothetical protein
MHNLRRHFANVAVLLVNLPGGEMPLLIEMVVDSPPPTGSDARRPASDNPKHDVMESLVKGVRGDRHTVCR